MTTTPQPTDGAIAPSFDTLVQRLWNAAYNNGVADSDDGHSSDKKYDDAYAATKSATTAVLEANALTVTMLDDAQARGDAWRDKYNADTDHIYQLRCMVRGFVNAFVASGYKPKKDSDNPGEMLLFRGIELLNRPADDRPAPLGGGVERNYDFTGWTETPLQLFDEARWPECLHATIQAFNVNNDPDATQAACMDTGLLHELSHLACGVAICLETSLADLRQRLSALGKGGA